MEDELKARLDRFSWVNWSEVARESALKKEMLLKLLEKLESKEEKEITKWSVELGRKAKKAAFKRLLSELSPKERKELRL